jgi:hypothetical protein
LGVSSPRLVYCPMSGGVGVMGEVRAASLRFGGLDRSVKCRPARFASPCGVGSCRGCGWARGFWRARWCGRVPLGWVGAWVSAASVVRAGSVLCGWARGFRPARWCEWVAFVRVGARLGRALWCVRPRCVGGRAGFGGFRSASGSRWIGWARAVRRAGGACGSRLVLLVDQAVAGCCEHFLEFAAGVVVWEVVQGPPAQVYRLWADCCRCACGGSDQEADVQVSGWYAQ